MATRRRRRRRRLTPATLAELRWKGTTRQEREEAARKAARARWDRVRAEREADGAP